ncbi:MAG: hypothetical protein HY847_12160 [Betaproteobacteria bacterium]|nr:hypothetical protein [Betaproteobacteria bacterium]
MIDNKWIRHELEPFEMAMERGCLRYFEKSAGAAYMFCLPESDYVSGQTFLWCPDRDVIPS